MCRISPPESRLSCTHLFPFDDKDPEKTVLLSTQPSDGVIALIMLLLINEWAECFSTSAYLLLPGMGVRAGQAPALWYGPTAPLGFSFGFPQPSLEHICSLPWACWQFVQYPTQSAWAAWSLLEPSEHLLSRCLVAQACLH